MQAVNLLPSAAYLRACFTYDHATGRLYWKRRPRSHFVDANACHIWNKKYPGTVAGHTWQGRYYKVSINKQSYMQHRVVWKLVTGKEPRAYIDHIDCNGLNNCWDNLRAANKSQQNWNVATLHAHNTSGYKGVGRSHGKWRAVIKIKNVQRNLGTFETAEEAVEAYETAARNLHGAFFREAR